MLNRESKSSTLVILGVFIIVLILISLIIHEIQLPLLPHERLALRLLRTRASIRLVFLGFAGTLLLCPGFPPSSPPLLAESFLRLVLPHEITDEALQHGLETLVAACEEEHVVGLDGRAPGVRREGLDVDCCGLYGRGELRRREGETY